MQDPRIVGLARQLAQDQADRRAVFRATLPDGRRIEARQDIGRYGSVDAVTLTLGTRLATRVNISHNSQQRSAGASGPPHVPTLTAADLKISMTEPAWGHSWLARPGVEQAVLGLFRQSIAKHETSLVLRPEALVFKALRPEPLPVDATTWTSWIDSLLALLVQAEACQPPAVSVERTALERIADDPKLNNTVVFVVLIGMFAVVLVLMLVTLIAMMMLR